MNECIKCKSKDIRLKVSVGRGQSIMYTCDECGHVWVKRNADIYKVEVKEEKVVLTPEPTSEPMPEVVTTPLKMEDGNADGGATEVVAPQPKKTKKSSK